MILSMLKLCTTFQVYTRIKQHNVNKSEGPDDIHPQVLSEKSEVLA